MQADERMRCAQTYFRRRHQESSCQRQYQPWTSTGELDLHMWGWVGSSRLMSFLFQRWGNQGPEKS